MPSPYDSAIDMFNLPRFGTGPTPFPKREDPVTLARRRLLEGSGAPVQDEDTFIQERASQSPDPFGVMEEVENLRREREEQGFLSDIAALNPAESEYNQSLMGLIQKNPRIAQSRSALGLIDVQRKLAPEQKDYTNQFRDPLYRASYQERVKRGLPPEAAYNETLNEAANEEMAIKLIEGGIPVERHGDLMTGGVFDRRKVAQAIAGAKTTKPWTDRLSDKESQMVREKVRESLMPYDFETEYAKVASDAEKAGLSPLSKDDYVRKYKNVGSFKEYQIKRALESGIADDLQREFGLTSKEVASLLGIPSSSGLAPEQPQALLSPAGAPQPPQMQQNAPQAAPVPNAAVPAVQQQVTPAPTPSPTPQPQPQASGYNAIPSYKHRLESTPIDSIIKGVEQAAPVIGNLASNLTTDPLGKISDIALGRGSEVIGEATMTPSQERDNAKWNTAKTSMMEYLNSLGKSPQEVEEMLGSILRGDRLPTAVFLKEGATKDDEGRMTASTALGQAFRRANKTAYGSALTDSQGSHGWEKVARALAQEYFTQKGVIAPTNNSAPTGAPQSQVSTVTTRAQYDALPSGTPYLDSQGRRAVKK